MSYIGNPIVSTDFPVDTFSGNGSTTAFTLTQAPASVNAIIVAVSGVLQEPSTYTISGTTLTFTAAPPSGTSNISVRHLGVAGIPNTPVAGSVQYSSLNSSLQGTLVGRNRIINGAMVIDQRNAGASVTPTDGAYTLDRWRAYGSGASKYTVQQNAGSVTPPAGFTYYLGVTSSAATTVGSSDYYMIRQTIEGYNIADLDFGKSTAKTVTLSFWVRSSLTGTFGGSLENSAGTYSYPFSYSISSANTWEQKTITITGQTAGTWGTTNGAGFLVQFSLGVGSTYQGTANAWANAERWSVTGETQVVATNGATFYITGVQLEVGSTATSFDYRPYGTELALCQRYYFKIGLKGSAALGSGVVESATLASLYIKFPTTMRASPTLSFNALGAADTAARTVSSIDSQSSSNDSAYILVTTGSGLTTGRGAYLYCSSDSGFLAGSIEL